MGEGRHSKSVALRSADIWGFDCTQHAGKDDSGDVMPCGGGGREISKRSVTHALRRRTEIAAVIIATAANVSRCKFGAQRMHIRCAKSRRLAMRTVGFSGKPRSKVRRGVHRSDFTLRDETRFRTNSDYSPETRIVQETHTSSRKRMQNLSIVIFVNFSEKLQYLVVR